MTDNLKIQIENFITEMRLQSVRMPQFLKFVEDFWTLQVTEEILQGARDGLK